MPLGPSSSAIHLQNLNHGTIMNPTFVTPVALTSKIILNPASSRRTIQNVTIHPVALFSILDHYLRRTDAQERVIGTLLGTRTETEIEVHSCFAVLHSETSEQVAVDMDYHRTMYDLHHKVNSKETIVGWYAIILLMQFYLRQYIMVFIAGIQQGQT